MVRQGATRRVTAVAVSLTLVSATAFAQPAEPPSSPPASWDEEVPAAPNSESEQPVAAVGDDGLLLHNGGMLRGDIIEVLPDSHVTIVVGGERRRIPWGDVAEVQHGKYVREPSPAQPAPAPVPTTPPTPTEERPSMGKPRVHLEVSSGRSVEMQRIVGGLYAAGYGVSMSGVTWETVCSSPCDRVVDASTGAPFVLGDVPLVFSRKFKLNDRSGDVHIDVKPGRPGVMIGGVLLTGVGGGLAVSGPMLIALDSEGRNWRQTGIILTAVGVPMLAAGIAMMVLGRTRYKIR